MLHGERSVAPLEASSQEKVAVWRLALSPPPISLFDFHLLNLSDRFCGANLPSQLPALQSILGRRPAPALCAPRSRWRSDGLVSMLLA